MRERELARGRETSDNSKNWLSQFAYIPQQQEQFVPRRTAARLASGVTGHKVKDTKQRNSVLTDRCSAYLTVSVWLEGEWTMTQWRNGLFFPQVVADSSSESRK